MASAYLIHDLAHRALQFSLVSPFLWQKSDTPLFVAVRVNCLPAIKDILNSSQAEQDVKTGRSVRIKEQETHFPILKESLVHARWWWYLQLEDLGPRVWKVTVQSNKKHQKTQLAERNQLAKDKEWWSWIRDHRKPERDFNRKRAH